MKTIRVLLALMLMISAVGCLFACTGPATPPEEGNAIKINFDGQNYSVSHEGVITVNGSALVISRGGTYELSGTLTDGQIRVKAPKTEDVTLVLNNLTINCSTSAPIYIESANKSHIRLAEGTVNTLTDAGVYVYEYPEQTKPNACLYSSEDLSIEGAGTLIINANYNNGIGTKNDLKIKSGAITVSAVKNALKGNDSVTVQGGTIEILKCLDGIKSDSLDAGKGFVRIEDGTISISGDDDGLQASQSLEVVGGSITISVADKPYTGDGTIYVAEGCVMLK